MKIKKLYIAIVALALSAGMTSCNDYLDKQPDSRLDLQSPTDVSKLLVNAYPQVHPAYLLEMYSDNTDCNLNTVWDAANRFQQQAYEWDDITETSDYEAPSTYWSTYYDAITTANIALEHINSQKDQSSYSAQKGEALLCRAYAMFQLANVFCMAYDETTAATDLGLPYPEVVETNVHVKYDRGTLAELYAKIDKDLQEGLKLVGSTYDKPKFHFTSTSAAAFAARFYLYYQKYDKAVEYANKVLGSNAKGMLTAEGLVLNLYYNRIEYPYEFRFVEKDSDPEKQLADSVTGSARYQAQVTQTAKTIPGYTLVSTENQAIHIAIEDGTTAVKNVKIFYYTEQTVDIKYEVVGPKGCGTLDNYQDVQLKVTTGEVKGSAPTAANGFKFVGWYKDEECTQPVDADWVEDNKLTPQKTKDYGGVMGYEAKTYYAKFAYDVFDLTVSKSGADAVDENQTFIFLISGEGVEMEVVVHGNSSVTVKGLKVGTYTVTELTDWSWRYTPHEAQKTVLQTDAQQAAANQTAHTVEFVNERKNSKWLNGAAFCDNRWITKTAINSATVEIN